jgi:glycosyltransferase involved in cell wall biosynthesis
MAVPVSVLVPAYNGGAYLAETLEAILGQSYAPAEVIVLNDGSTDTTTEVVARYPAVRCMTVANGGICKARNQAAALATSPYLAFCDQDDVWRSDKLERQMALHARNPELRYSFTNFAFLVDGMWSKNTKMDDAPLDFFDAEGGATAGDFEYESSLYESLLRFQPIWPSTIVIAADFYRELGGFREEFGKNPSEDLEFTLRCVQQPPIGVVSEPVVGVRRHTGNYSKNNLRTVSGQIEILQYALEHHAVSDATRAMIREQIALRRVEASYSAFQEAEFEQFVALLHGTDPGQWDSKTKLKFYLCKMPRPLTRVAHAILVRG